MFTQLIFALVAFMTVNLASAWRLTPEHTDGLYGITQDEEIHLVMDWNSTIAASYRPKTTNSFRTAPSKRGNGLPSGTLECNGGYVNANDLASCLTQAEAWCGLGTIGTGAKLTDYTAYAFKSGLVFLYICDWNYHWFYTGSTTCFSAEVAATIGLVENHCGYGSGKTQVQAGYYLLDDWNIGFGYQTLGVDGCPGLKGNHDGEGTNPSPKYIAQSLPQGGATSSSASQLPSSSPTPESPSVVASASDIFPSSSIVVDSPSSAPAIVSAVPSASGVASSLPVQPASSAPAPSAPAPSSGPAPSIAPAPSSAPAPVSLVSSASGFQSSFIPASSIAIAYY